MPRIYVFTACFMVRWQVETLLLVRTCTACLASKRPGRALPGLMRGTAQQIEPRLVQVAWAVWQPLATLPRTHDWKMQARVRYWSWGCSGWCWRVLHTSLDCATFATCLRGAAKQVVSSSYREQRCRARDGRGALAFATNSRLGKASTCEHVECGTYCASGSVLYASLDAAMRAEYMRERSDTCAEY